MWPNSRWKRRKSTQAPFDIFHLDSERGFRGGERQLLYLACALRSRGHRNMVVCRKGSPLAEAAGRLALEVCPLPFLSELDPWSAYRLRTLARRSIRPVLHAHTAHTAGTAAMAAWRTIPWVAHRRVDFPLAGSWSLHCKYARAGRVIAVSRAIQQVLVNSGLAEDRIDVVCDAIPADAQELSLMRLPANSYSLPTPQERERMREGIRSQFGIPPGNIWIGNLAALVPHKDHDTLLAAALIVILERPQTIFVVAGEGPEGPRLLEQVKRMGLTGKVFLIGEHSRPLELLKTFDIFALSSWGEGMGSVLLEARACRVPIAATSAGGIPEIVADGSTGILGPPRSPEILARNLMRLMDDRVLALRLAEEGAKDLQRFGLERMAVAMEAVYAHA